MEGGVSFLTDYLSPFIPLFKDESVVEIVVNPDGGVWVENQGQSHMVQAPSVKISKPDTDSLASAIAGACKASLSKNAPIVSGKINVLDYPIRAQVLVSPAVDDRPSLSFRKYSESQFKMADIELLHGRLVNLDELRQKKAQAIVELAQNNDVAAAMQLCIKDRLNIVISGGTSTGKTTFARALLSEVSKSERIVTIEDALELFPPQPNKVMLKAERKEGSVISAEKLLEATLRLRPDRIILGELRGSESKTFLDAINTGHSGSFTTIHADTASKAIDRLALMVMSVGMNMSFEAVRHYCVNSIDVIVQLGRKNGKRGISEIYIPTMRGNEDD